ncbi:MAG: glycoside hydrolase family 32 protein [Prevotella sp.]|nr:glycoside hydrolase family 32 protein [Prevotella sp.]
MHPLMVAIVLVAIIAGCSKDDDYKPDYNPLIDDPEEERPIDNPQPPTTSSRNEHYRPQIHFTPNRNWMNDPNGMVYADGTYHLFYQYNPQGNDWGNMSWGHAISKDMLHWTEQSVALTRDELGDVFSGSAVIDKNNTAGFGANALVAIYTSASGAQQQSVAYSTDGGKTFTRYAQNPVIANNDDNLRDPKVFWHEESKKWVMALAKGWKMGVDFYSSTDLKNWSFLSNFFIPLAGRPSLQWECPDLISFDYNGQKKWVLIVSVNPGGPILGSGTMYFVGQFDGTTFIPDDLSYPLWLDYGMDNYAGVTWSNTGDRRLLIGWMNNWQYAGAVPCEPWRSAMTLPRELRLVEREGKPLLTCAVVSEIDQIAGSWQPATAKLDVGDAYQLRVTVSLDHNSTITLGNSQDEKFVVDVNASTRSAIAYRNAQSGQTRFSGSFSIPSMQAPLNTVGASVTLDFFVDQSSVELLTSDGSMSMTNLVFPQTIYNTLSVSGGTYEAQVRQLKSVWK